MQDLQANCRVALIQAAPVLFDKAKTLAKTEALVQSVLSQKPDLIVFPELFIPGYPYGLSFGFSVGHRDEPGRRDWQLYANESVVVPGPETQQLGKMAAAAKAYLSIGVSERDGVSGTLYNSNLIFAPDGKLVSIHRKLKPTGSERVVWGDANQDYFPIAKTPWGPVGNLICWESYMPLARVALYQKGITIYIAPNTNDNPEWQATMTHIALEGRVYVINADMYLTKAMYPQAKLAYPDEVQRLPETVIRGGSGIFDPFGQQITEPLWDKEGILYADLAMDKVVSSRMAFDPCGHYARPDVLHLDVREPE